MPIEVIAFDLMDTLVVDPFHAVVRPSLGERLAEFDAARDGSSWLAFESGRMTEADAFARFYQPGSANDLPSPQALRTQIFDAVRFIDGVEALLATLTRCGCQLWLLSNYPIWFETLRTQLALDRFFTGYVVSYEVGVRKPDSAIYEALLMRAGVGASSCLFVDDRPINIDGAIKAGLDAIHFTDLKNLQTELCVRALLSEKEI